MAARRCFLVLCLLLGASLVGRLAKAQAALDTAAVDGFIEGEMRAQRVPGLALAITRGAEVLYVKGYGGGGGRAVTPQTQFHVASLSKGMTAVAVLLPEAGVGFVLLYDVHSVAQELLAFPRFKAGLAALLTGGAVPGSGFGTGPWGGLMAAVTLLGLALAVRSLLRLPQWTEHAATLPAWRLLPGVLLSFLPLLLVLAMPALVLAFSGRAFGYVTLFRAMVGPMTWLTLVGVLGAVNGVARLVMRW